MIQVISMVDELSIIPMKKLAKMGIALNELAKTIVSHIKLADRKAGNQKNNPEDYLLLSRTFQTMYSLLNTTTAIKDDLNSLIKSLGDLLIRKDAGLRSRSRSRKF